MDRNGRYMVGAILAALAFVAAGGYGAWWFGSGWDARESPLELSEASELPSEVEYVNLQGGEFDPSSRRVVNVMRSSRRGGPVTVAYSFLEERYVTPSGSVVTTTLGTPAPSRSSALGVYLPRSRQIVCSRTGTETALAVRTFLASALLGFILCLVAAGVAARGGTHLATRGTEPAPRIAHYRESAQTTGETRFELRHRPSPVANSTSILLVAASLLVPMFIAWDALGEIPSRDSAAIFYPVPLLAAGVMAMAFFLNRGTITVTPEELARTNALGWTTRTRIDAQSFATSEPISQKTAKNNTPAWRVRLAGPGEDFFVARLADEESAVALETWLNASMKRATGERSRS